MVVGASVVVVGASVVVVGASVVVVGASVVVVGASVVVVGASVVVVTWQPSPWSSPSSSPSSSLLSLLLCPTRLEPWLPPSLHSSSPQSLESDCPRLEPWLPPSLSLHSLSPQSLESDRSRLEPWLPPSLESHDWWLPPSEPLEALTVPGETMRPPTTSAMPATAVAIPNLLRLFMGVSITRSSTAPWYVGLTQRDIGRVPYSKICLVFVKVSTKCEIYGPILIGTTRKHRTMPPNSITSGGCPTTTVHTTFVVRPSSPDTSVTRRGHPPERVASVQLSERVLATRSVSGTHRSRGPTGVLDGIKRPGDGDRGRR